MIVYHNGSRGHHALRAKRYRGTYYLPCQRAWAYLLFLLSVLAVGLAGLVELRRAPRREMEAATGVAG